MGERYFIPRIGRDWEPNRILIMSESAYDWIGDDGKICSPQSSHPDTSIAWTIADFGGNQYFRSMSRALCGTAEPTEEKLRQAWDAYAYTIFVQGSVGFGAGVRPTAEQWSEAGHQFLSLVEELRPLKVVVTGKDMWRNMPECSAHLSGDVQAYRRSDGELIWCLAVPHPANRVEGFRWELVGEYIGRFKEMQFPTH